MAILVHYKEGNPLLIRNAPNLEVRLRNLGQPMIKKIEEGYELTWIVTKRVGHHEFEPAGIVHILKLPGEIREIKSFELIGK